MSRTYTAVFGAYVRMYAYHDFEASSDKHALARAQTEFKKKADQMGWDEMDTANLALPSVVDISRTVSYRGEHKKVVAENVDFAVCEEDARDLASKEMLTVLEAIEAHMQARRDTGKRREEEGYALRARIKAVIKKAKEF